MLTSEKQKIYTRIVTRSRAHRRLESKIIDDLILVEKTKLFKDLDKPSLFKFTVDILEFTEPVAYAFISVARKSLEIPELLCAIRERKLSVSKASRVVSALTKENAVELIEFAKTHTYREVDREVARLNPKPGRNKVKIVSENQIEVTVTLERFIYDNLKRVESLLAQKNQPANMPEAISVCTESYLDAHDPVRKAARNVGKPAKHSNHGNRPTAHQMHVVNLRDQGRCTHIGRNGKRCDNDRWVATHHIKFKSMGGTNDPENLTTLCSFHHDRIHQRSMEGQFSWMRR